MDLNPEFRRNLWLELSVHRLVAMPAILALVLALVYTASDDKLDATAGAAALVAAVLLGIWGTRCAADCVMEEVRARTWDGQRMSAIGPWAMTWGKLFGSSSFAWYGGLMSLAVVLLAAPRGWEHPPAKVAALIVSVSLLVQGMACFAGLVAPRKGYARPGAFSVLLVVLLLIFMGPAASLVGAEGHLPVRWWGQSYERVNFVLASAACFAAWAVFGCYRLMCAELQVRTLPWAFVAFAAFLTAYLPGFWIVPEAGFAGTLNVVLIGGLLIAAALTYVQLLSEHSGVIVFRRVLLRLRRGAASGPERDAHRHRRPSTAGVLLRLRRGETQRALEELPCWPIGLALAGAFSVLGLLLLDPIAMPGSSDRSLALVPLPAFLLLARDAAILLVFAFAWQPRRVETAAFFYLVLLYGIVPALLKAAGLETIAELVLPPVLEAPGKATLVAAVQLAIAVALVQWRLRAYARREAKA